VAVLDDLETHGDDLIIEIVRGSGEQNRSTANSSGAKIERPTAAGALPPRNFQVGPEGLAKAAGSQGPYMGVPPRSTIHPSSSSRATIAARDETPSLAKTRLRWEATVHELMSSTEAIVLLG
jgi:hypothetical protein